MFLLSGPSRWAHLDIGLRRGGNLALPVLMPYVKASLRGSLRGADGIA